MLSDNFKHKQNKKSISISLDIDINEKLEKYLERINLSKSEYIEFLIKADIKKADN